jgi:hypothetical protein
VFPYHYTGKGATNYVGIWVEIYVASVHMPWYGERGVNSGTARKGGAGDEEGAVWLKGQSLSVEDVAGLNRLRDEVGRVKTVEVA